MEYSDFKQTVPGEGAALPLPLSTSTTPKTASRTAPWWTPLKYLIPTVLLARYIFLPLILPSSDLDFHFSLPSLSTHDAGARAAHKSSCKQAAPLYPSSFDVSAEIEGKKDKVIDWLSGAVKIPTEIYDVMGPIGKDPRWDVFYTFAEYLEQSFPLVHEHLTRTRVMTHALVYEWQGTDSSLKPLLLTGHQDVVPVLNATRGLWTHDPFGGEYDPETDRIWGRGSMDDKSGTIGALSAIELLLESGKFTPTRTVILALGIDEETGGKVGALNLGKWLEAKYGKDSMAILVDEGSGMQTVWGQLYATPAVGEKGYLDAELRVETLGAAHTGIGLISLLIAALEHNPHRPYLNPTSPLVNYLECAAEFSDGMPKGLRKAVFDLEDSLSSKRGEVDNKALEKVLDWWVEGSVADGTLPKGMGKAMVSTTQAVDIINGGVKPEVVTAVINHRISLASSVEELQQQITKVLKPVAEKYNLALESFGSDVELEECPMLTGGTKAGKVIVAEAYNSSLNPAPVSPFTVDSPAWRVLSGTVKSVYATRPSARHSAEEAAKHVIMAPSISTGNTDTKRYWNLTKNIYRFAYLDFSNGMHGAHTVDEYMEADNFFEQVRWFMNFIVNVDESREL